MTARTRRRKYGEQTARIQAEIPASLKSWLELQMAAENQRRPLRGINLTEALVAALRAAQQCPEAMHAVLGQM